MAEKRMMTKKVTDDDHFLSLSSSAQALYLHLSMNADDDGFCNQVTASMFKAHASVQDLEALLEKRYVYQFENGVIVIKHWRMANALRKDRYTPTAFQNELAMLRLEDNGAYTWQPNGNQLATKRQPNGNQTATEIREDKIRLDYIPSNEGRATDKRFAPPTVEQVREYIAEKGLAVNAEHFVDYYAARGWKLGKGQPMKDWQAAVRTWANLDKERKAEKGGAIIESFDPEKTAADALERSMREMLEAIGND